MAAVMVFAVFLIAIAVSIPISVSMILGSVAPIEILHKGGSVVQLLNNTFSGANSTPILAVPLFILGGVIMAKGGISRKLFNFFAYFAGHFTGGLPCAVILTCLFYGAISGSGPATTAAVGAMCVPFLTDLGYDRTWSAGLIAVAGGLGVIIPPSIPFVLYSLATGVSTGDLFLGGVFPGILIGLALMVYAVYYCARHGEDKEKIKARMDELAAQGFLKLFKDSFWALLCPVIVLGGIYTGFTTPTEAATVSVFYALIVSLFIYKTMKISELIPMLCESVKTYGGPVLDPGYPDGGNLHPGELPFQLYRPDCPGGVLLPAGHGHGYGSGHHHPGTGIAAGLCETGCGSCPSGGCTGMLPVHRSGHAAIRLGPVRGREHRGTAAHECGKKSCPLHPGFRGGLVRHHLCAQYLYLFARAFESSSQINRSNTDFYKKEAIS